MHEKWTSVFFILSISLVVVRAVDDVWHKSHSLKVSDTKVKLSKSALPDGFVTEPLSDLGITVPPEDANLTVARDYHTYYNTTFYFDTVSTPFWVNLDSLPKEQVITHEMLSDSHRQATTVNLTFDFPFYGTLLKNVTIATGGFLYTGDYLHNWIAATQYIAPLMANFDTSISPDSTIKYVDNGSSLVVQWDNIRLQEKDNDKPFTFQTTLKNTGDIIFSYKEVPYPVVNISDQHHPVKIGLSDAYILEKTVFFIHRRTIFEYHKIDMMNQSEVSSGSAIYFIALPTCNTKKDCLSCLASDPKLKCNWCDAVSRCSDSVDRLRQNWVVNGCTLQKEASCSSQSGVPASTEVSDKSLSISTKKTVDVSTKESSVKTSTFPSSSSNNINMTDVPQPKEFHGEVAHYKLDERNEGNGIVIESKVSTGAIVTIVMFLAALISAGVWVVYAYKNPQTSSGQFLIKYRPSQWSIKKEDTGLTSNSRHL